MICPSCGEQVAATEKRCPLCGVQFAVSSQTGALGETFAGETFAGETFAGRGTSLGQSPDPKSKVNDFAAGLPTFGGPIPHVGVTTLTPPEPLEVDTTGLPRSAGGVRHRRPGSAPSVLEVGRAFGTRYHILKLLGAGGMGAVYQAWDFELNVVVALKVIRSDDAEDREAAAQREKQFKTELLLARQVTHKNVVRIHDLGVIDGIKYITMPFVHGDDLATIIKQTAPLGIARTLDLARDIAAGLTAAHDAGIVHRDLKPANIMVGPEDQAIILDFGIARSAAHGEGGITGIVGTLEYMAPEQTKPGDVDQRADVYAFGVILYEMLLGRRKPSSPDSAVADMRARITKGLPRVRSLSSEVPEAVDELVAKCVEIDPAARFQTSAEVLARLDRLDEKGELIPEPRRITRKLVMATVVIVAALLGGTFFVTRQAILPEKQHDPVSVVIADLQNNTGDPAFDRTLEPMLKRALEGAGFISAFDHNGMRSLDDQTPAKLDEDAARKVAVKQGLGVVLSGSLDQQGSSYNVSVKASETVSGKVLAESTSRASNKTEVLGVANGLMAVVRRALGDTASESSQIFAMASLSATSLDVVKLYAASQEAASNGKLEEARQNAQKAVEIDPTFGIGYQLLAVQSRNMRQQQDAAKYVAEALKYVDKMTDRERLSTRGLSYRISGDYQQCAREYGDLIARFNADVVGRNQLALCLTKLRDWRKALEQQRSLVGMLPNRLLFRYNLAWYLSYSTDFKAAEEVATGIKDPDAYSTLGLAFAQVGQGRRAEAIETYTRLGTMNAPGPSASMSGLADLAALEGRLSEAADLYTRGAAQDLAAKNMNRAATKFAALARVELERGRKTAAIAAVDTALANSQVVEVRFLAARILIEADQISRAKDLIAGLSGEIQLEPRTYAKILQGEVALKSGDRAGAIDSLNASIGILDTWIAHFDLGRVYLSAKAWSEADSEFDRCVRRRGEAMSLFLDEEPTYAFFAPVYYYVGKARQEMGTAQFADSYRQWLEIRGGSKEDPLVPQVRKITGQ